jgi:hypothetical protein
MSRVDSLQSHSDEDDSSITAEKATCQRINGYLFLAGSACRQATLIFAAAFLFS